MDANPVPGSRFNHNIVIPIIDSIGDLTLVVVDQRMTEPRLTFQACAFAYKRLAINRSLPAPLQPVRVRCQIEDGHEREEDEKLDKRKIVHNPRTSASISAHRKH